MPSIKNSNKFADKYKLKSPRLKNWDYSNLGLYFITIYTLNHNKFFGKIIDEKMELSKIGQITNIELIKTIKIRKNVYINPWVIMPNHVHLLVHVETRCSASLQQNQKPLIIIPNHRKHPNYFSRLNIKSNQIIPNTIRSFKSAVTRQCKQNNLFFSWQSRFHDRLIRNQKEYSAIKSYIKNNPNNWQKDTYHK